MPAASPQYLRVAQVAARWNLGVSTVYRLIETGEISHIRFGESIRVPLGAVLEYERRQLGTFATSTT